MTLVLTKKWVNYHNETLIKILNTLTIILAIGYFLSDIVTNYIFQSAEDMRRKDLIDHSVSTQLADQNSIDYFTNNEIAPGIYKLGVNIFESSFFSKSIAEKMVWPAFRKVLLIILVFTVATLWADNEGMTTILQMALPYTIIQQFIRLLYYKHRLSGIYDTFVTIFQTPKNGRQSNLLLHNAMTYDSTHAWASIKLSQRLYDKWNPDLTAEWAALKQRLNIQ
jgi:hypothetical protein